MKEFKTLKLKGFITLQNILFVKYSLKVLIKIFQQSTTIRYQNTRSACSFQLGKGDFLTEKYGQFSMKNKISAYQIGISYRSV